MPHILHINDNNLVIQSGATRVRSQGYAWLKGDNVLFDNNPGHSPVKHCRLSPQEINSRYWQQCEQSSIANNAAGMRHAADLIWKHLSELKAQHSLHEIILVVPSHYQSRNLQLLLGIAKSCNLTVVGLINKAVLALRDQIHQEGVYCHLDVQLHQTVNSTVSANNGIAKLGAIDIIQGVGIQAMQDALLKALQDSFIQNDRFDPLHYAETEQQLFDQLSTVAQQIQKSGKASMGVNYQHQLHTTSIDAKRWDDTLANFIHPLTKAGSTARQTCVDMNAAFSGAVPAMLVQSGAFIITEVPRGADDVLHDGMINNGALVYQTELPINTDNIVSEVNVDKSVDKPVGVVNQQQSSPDTATHLLQAGIAVPIEYSEVRTANNQLSLHACAHGNAQSLLATGKIFIMNDEARRIFKPNDRLGSPLGDGVITVIQVV